VMSDLNVLIAPNSGWTLVDARTINDIGQIAGFGIANGAQHALRLDPTAAGFVGLVLDAIASFNLPKDFSADISSVLFASLDALKRGSYNTARNQLGAFENKVSAQRGKNLTTTQADFLLNITSRAIPLI